MIFDEIRHHHGQEHAMPASTLQDAATFVAKTASNPLIATLAEHGLGEHLTPGEINLICTLVDTVERQRRQPTGPMAAPVPETEPEPAPVAETAQQAAVQA
jgi:hypothetical protein